MLPVRLLLAVALALTARVLPRVVLLLTRLAAPVRVLRLLLLLIRVVRFVGVALLVGVVLLVRVSFLSHTLKVLLSNLQRTYGPGTLGSIAANGGALAGPFPVLLGQRRPVCYKRVFWRESPMSGRRR